MDGLMNFVTDYKLIDIIIGLMGIFGYVLVWDRFKALYFDLSLPAEPFMKQVISLINQDKIEEAITFCAANEKKPLAYVVKAVLEKSDREESAMGNAMDLAASDVAPKLSKRLGYLPMIGNVVTLIGLLGTVLGLIVAFKAVSFADPSQKQTLLAQGISIAMTATAAGLAVAIPTMFFYSFLHSKQSQLFSEIDRNCQRLMETLRTRTYMPFAGASIYPTLGQSNSKTPTPPTGKVS